MTFKIGSKDFLISFPEGPEGKDAYALLSKVMEIGGVNDFIVEQPILPAWRDDIQKMEFIRAIQGTLALEGSELEVEDVERIAGQDAPSLNSKDKEAENALKAYDFIQEWSHDNVNSDITEAVIRQIHTVVTRDIDYYLNIPGEYRNQPVSFGIPKRQSELKDKFAVAEAMSRLVELINDTDSPVFGYAGHPIMKAILVHYFMTFIHPFIDGNGRVSRALEALILYHQGNFGNFLFPISAKFYYSERRKYFTLLREVDEGGDPYPFIKYSIGGLLDNLTSVKERINNKITEIVILDYAHQLKREKKLLKRQTILLQAMFYTGPLEASEFWRHPAIRGIYQNLSTSTRKRDINNLSKHGFVTTERSEKSKSIIMVNWDLLKVVTLRLENVPLRPS